MKKIFYDIVAGFIVMASLVMIYNRYKAGWPIVEVFFIMPVSMWFLAFFIVRKKNK